MRICQRWPGGAIVIPSLFFESRCARSSFKPILMNSMKANSKCCDPRVAAVALGRWCIGLIFLFAGIGKFGDLNGFANNLAQQYQKTWLPQVLVKPFGYLLPFWEVIVGALLLLGLFRNASLFGAGILLLLLVFGQILAGNPAVVFYNTAYVF